MIVDEIRHYQELARRLQAAFLSHRLGNKSVDYTLKRYCTGQVDQSWLEVARILSEGIEEGIAKLLDGEEWKQT